MSRKGRILVVENESRWRDALTSVLQKGGFAVETAATLAQATERLDKGFYHLAVLDIRLDDDSDPEDNEGLALLRKVKGDGQYQVEIVMLSAFGTMQQMREAFAEYNVADFIDKSEFEGQEFAARIQDIFSKKVKINLNLDIRWPNDEDATQQIIPLKFQGEKVRHNSELRELLATELEDLLCRLFFDAESLLIESVTPGHSGAAVLRATPYYLSGVGKSVIIKFGPAEQIEAEASNFLAYVQNFIGGSRNTVMLARNRTPRLAGIAYSLIGTASHHLESFGSFYQRAEQEQINQVISHVILETCQQWYANAGRLALHELAGEYTKRLRLTPENLEQALHDLKSAQGKTELHLATLPGRVFTNPLPAIVGRRFNKTTYVCTTHGDLNENNFLIDEAGQTWLIDFGNTGSGHILRDVAELDAAVRIQLLTEDDATLDERLMMEGILCGAKNFGKLAEIEIKLTTQNPALTKAFATTIHIRKLAHKLVERRPGDDMSDYQIALTYYALGYLRYYELSRLQREHALLSASLLVDNLQIGGSNV